MLVVELGTLRECGEDVQKCSICCRYKTKVDGPKNTNVAPDEFGLIQYRYMTNCNECYMTGIEETKVIREDAKRVENSEQHKKLVTWLEERDNVLGSSVAVEDMISALQQLPKGSRLVTTQKGYYAHGNLGSIFLPEKHECVVDSVYSIGHSEQDF